jgi:hypothetical protein
VGFRPAPAYKPKANTWCPCLHLFRVPAMPLWSYLYVGPRCHCSGVLAVKEELQRIYDSVPEDEPRARLEPYRELILRWRRQGRTYHRIRELLATRCNLTVAYVTLYRFIKKCSRPRKPKPDLDLESATVQPVAPVRQAAATSIPKNSNQSGDPYAEVRERMRKHKEAPPPLKPRKIFEVPEEDDDEIKPLRMMPPSTQKEK